ncbi:hypothetical protein NPIL_405771 [Nephila pilipes]|uniref:Uncharacterized protein n=1 Tax=Nephila pilipes TaxID=299642 RepID=A0A8X6PWP9_NEPPI|nr:hypothetical protein NPIL_405771 [Nephila pilipes]
MVSRFESGPSVPNQGDRGRRRNFHPITSGVLRSRRFVSAQLSMSDDIVAYWARSVPTKFPLPGPIVVPECRRRRSRGQQ